MCGWRGGKELIAKKGGVVDEPFGGRSGGLYISQGDPSERVSIYCRMTEDHGRQTHDENTIG